MIIAHLADLHLGKNVNGFNMIEDQKYILKEIMDILKQEEVQAVVIAGDVYDRSVPSTEASVLLDHFLSSLQEEGYEVFMTSGNHDSGERLAYASSLLDQMHIHVVGTWSGKLLHWDLKDAYGTIRFHLMPFIRPVDVNRYVIDEKDKVKSWNEALRKALETAELSEDRNVILSHQFVTGSLMDKDGSEEFSVGGVDQVDGHLYDAFDYVALGHIHRPQKLLRETMRYAGTPLPYSFSEAGQMKSVPVIDLKEKGNVSVHLCPLTPMHAMREIHGTYQEIMDHRGEDEHTDDYMHITLNDEEDVVNAIQTLRIVYPNIMKLDYDNTRTRAVERNDVIGETEKQDPLEIFEKFYEMRNGRKMSEEQIRISADLMAEIRNGKEKE